MSLLSTSGPDIVSLGCRLNIAESENIRALLGGREAIVINSCAVTAEAVRSTRRAIRRARARRPHAPLYVTGCAATIDPQAFRGMVEVDHVVPNAAKLAPESWGAAAAPAPPAFTGHARAFVEVQNGCDHGCTFCIIPAGRGASRSLPAGGVIEHVRALVDGGHREVVLTGVDLTSYGPDLPGRPTLGALVQRILAHVPQLERLRLSSLDSIEIDDALFEVLTGEDRVMPHVHLSLQAGDDMVLKRMKRRHARADAIRIVERLKAARPDIAIGADLIAGFPTETPEMFANTARLIEDCDIVFAHIFPFSAREGTPAARMPQVEPEVIRARAAELRALGEARKAKWLSDLVGTTQRVLVERPGDRGHAENFAEIRLPPAAVGSVATVRITAADGAILTGIPA
ncbi:tRNA (N(6)-L-threonylcarbamoyladenosine(37)-C(2))-methylthiotransferase MtaB [Sphingomonas gilva]|uniref:tRNA (N(6)-L-threonylcarbamoyladenosine(37)-C(2))-methylthiotransferase MtaB n=1 Tax=Sphingomonas gilva TaxID=2305907 RepID=A0A396RN12_9SPHN|nr:tRNA (N(6)-L-threonylcarbamoyladenosine(37)-C(2))-methylthiotransferase MtaB [Sphingomonas gilva]RHW17106.1 tRNA (N(6)-L-threonylcarbamoyladenosine(37)-C(2))-methylthiotransferase MtaB [Sphingomonas gilva]